MTRPARRNCLRCGKRKAVTQFSKAANGKGGLQGWCKDCMVQYKRDYAEEHGESYSRLSNIRLRWDALVHYSQDPPTCTCCGDNTYEFLALDHINGGGRQHRQQGGWSRLSAELRRQGYPPGYRVLCHNCNQAMGHYGFCPHQHPERRITSRPVDKRTQMGKESEARVLAAATQLVLASTVPTIAKLAALTNLSTAAVYRHRANLKRQGILPAVAGD